MSRLSACRTQVARRWGFTIVEFLVVIAIVGVLFALLLPAVRMARESARVARCANNLRQFGVAIHHYHDAQRVFPLGMAYGTVTRKDNLSLSSSWSMHSFLLPYLEQEALFKAINFDHNVNKHEGYFVNSTARLLRVSMFLCPSDPATSLDQMGNNYVASIGPDYYVVKPMGMFGSLLSINETRVTDGLAQTIFMSERRIDRGNPGQLTRDTVVYIEGNPTFDIPKSNGDHHKIAALDNLIQRCNDSKQELWWYNGRQWGRAGLSWTLFNTLTPPNWGRNCMHGNIDVPWDRGILPPSSHHNQGVNLMMGDGTVRFASDGIDVHVFRSLGSRAGNEILPQGAF